MTNALLVINPYCDSETWMFDDEAAGLRREPFVMGIPEMIEDLVKDIPNARQGFRLVFSDKEFPGAVKTLVWVRDDMGGAWYRTSDPPMEGWLCPALYRYFDRAPKKLFMRAEALAHRVGPNRRKWWEFWK